MMRQIFVAVSNPALSKQLFPLLNSLAYEIVCLDLTQDIENNIANKQPGSLLLTDAIEDDLFLYLRHQGIPTVVLAAQGEIQAAVNAMRAGAVDYIHDLSVARLGEALAHAQAFVEHQSNLHHLFDQISLEIDKYMPVGHAPASLKSRTKRHQMRDLAVNLNTRHAEYRNQPFELSPTEFDILHCLLEAQGEIVSFEDLVAAVQQTEVDRPQARKMLSAHISNLRAKMRQVGCAGYLANKRGIGYHIEPDIEAAYQRQEEILQLIVENTQDMIFVADEHFVIRFMSPSIETLLGYEPDDFIGISAEKWLEYVHEEDHVLFTHLEDMEISGRRIRYRARHRDGNWLWLEVNAKMIYDNEGNPNGFIAIVRDVNDAVIALHNLQQSQQSLQEIIKHLPMVILRFDTQKRYQYVKNVLETTTMLSQDYYIGKTMREINIPEETATHWDDVLDEVLITGQEQFFDRDIVLDDENSEVVHLETGIFPECDENGNIISIVSITGQSVEMQDFQKKLKKVMQQVIPISIPDA